MPRRKLLACCVPVLTVACLLVWTRSYAQDPPGGGGGAVGPVPAPGAPRHWEPGLQVNDYSNFNLSNGNLVTILPLVGWDPVGPAVGFALYHNSASANEEESGAPGAGFDLGPGWSVSYSGRIEEDPNSTDVAVIEDDGTRNVYTLVDGRYEPAGGVHDRLEPVEDPPESGQYFWVLTRPNQRQRIFDANGEALDGLLLEEKDSSANTVTIERDANGRLTRVVSAAGGSNDLDFHYDGRGRLAWIRDAISRYWYFNYDQTNDWLESVDWPWDEHVPASSTDFTYTEGGLIVTVTARDELTWTYSYTDGVLSGVTDPTPDPNNPYTPDPNDPYEQSLRTVITIGGGDHSWKREVRDRRGYWWTYFFDEDGNLVKRKDPLDQRRRYTYDADHNLLTFKDELSHVWTATYGPIGNLETLTSPLPEDPITHELQTWTLSWEAVADPNTTNFYRLTQISDPADKWVQFQYADPNDPNDPNDPTLLTRVIEMPDGQGEPNAVTEIKYYDSPNALGQLRKVIDANGVKTEQTYDSRGYLAEYQEGFADPPQGMQSYPVWYGTVEYDGVGRPLSREWEDPQWAYHICRAYWDAMNNSRGADGGSAPTGRLGDPPSPEIPLAWPSVGGPGWGVPTYTAMGLLTAVHIRTDPIDYLTALAEDLETERRYTIEYDEFRNVAQVTIDSYGESGPTVGRVFAFPDYDPEGRLLQEHGPGGETSLYTYSARGKLENVWRDDMTATLTYDGAGRLTQIEYGNGTREVRSYDEANRLTQIRHEDAAEVVMWSVTYDWTINDWVASRTEFDNTVSPPVSATVDFEYDNRGRLIRETRVVDGASTVYDLTYAYDQLGNRLSRFDSVSERRLEYTYDTQLEPGEMAYPTRNNRLLKYELYEPDGQGGERLMRTVTYIYYDTGDVSNITIKDEYIDAQTTPGEPNDYEWHYDLALYYDMGHKLRIGLWDRWKLDGQGQPSDYELLQAREFRYDAVIGGPRARYLAVDYDADYPQPRSWTIVEPIVWTDYDGVLPYQDADVSGDGQGGYALTPITRYLGTVGDQALDPNGPPGDPNDPNAPPLETRFYHGDLIGSTSLVTDQGGTAVSAVSYSAFGEILCGTGFEPVGCPAGRPGGSAPQGYPRYQYAGRWGYETGGFSADPGGPGWEPGGGCSDPPCPSHLLALYGANPNLPPITLLHVGARWYQPSIGRFIQRDPVGMAGGLNAYVYAVNDPVSLVDPEGLEPPNGPPWPPGGGPGRIPGPTWRIPGKVFIFVTGGGHSWLDDPRKVRRAQNFSRKISLLCILGAAHPAAAIGVGIAIGAGEVWY